ncbi:MAG TPA: class I SAM-dependent methyltransferase [Longimicrobiales bacterium]|nr:class I SAM-dependent methyltransferase [Longimicrobiales bacterium]
MTSYEIGPCPACGSNSAATVANADDMRDELEQLWAFHTRRLRPDTPPDMLRDRVTFSQKPPLAIVRCEHCSLLFRNPRERADRLVELYSTEDPDDVALLTLLRNQRPSYAAQARRLTRVFGRTGRGLEVGCYVGAFLDAARDHGWNFAGVDVNDNANAFARRAGHRIETTTIEDSSPAERYDVIAFWNCFEQLPDPVAAARAAHQRLLPGGMIALRVPNGDFYAAWRHRLHSSLRLLARTFLAHNNLLAFPYRHGFTPHSLQLLLRHTGFRIDHLHGDTLVPIADPWTRRWAAAEERISKRILAAAPPAHSPWLELYARAL